MKPVTYVEFNVAALPESVEFFKSAFDWDLQPFGEDYFVAPAGDEPGIDTGIMPSQDGQPRTVAVITVDDMDAAIARVTEHGGTIVVPRFAVETMGYAAYFKDPGGLIVGLYESDPTAA